MAKTKVITFTNQKGGVGKSTTCFNVGIALSLCGYRVLFIDADPQGDLSTMSGLKELDDDDYSLYEVLHGVNINKAIHERENFSIIPSNEDLARGELDLMDEPRTVLQKAIHAIRGDLFDYILIDCPPSLNVLTIDALTASDEVIVPVMAQYLPLKGVARLKDTIEKTRASLNPGLKIGGIVVTFYNARRNLDQQVRESLESAFGAKVFETFISHNTKVAEAPSHGLSIFEYAPQSKGAKQYMSLAQEITKRKCKKK